jgi:hypothetical protein
MRRCPGTDGHRLGADPGAGRIPLRVGSNTYEFFDPAFCHCTYVGGAKEYAELQRLRQARANEHQQLLRTSLSGSADPDPNLWGPWSPEGLDVK